MVNVALQRPSIQANEFLLMFSEDDSSANIAGPLTWQQIMKEIDQVDNPSKVHAYNIVTKQGKDITEDCAWSALIDLELSMKLNIHADFVPFIANSDALERFHSIEAFESRLDRVYGTYEQQHRLTYRDVV